ncbi:MAG: hypothetical protein L3I91_01305 [Mycoplasma sp.]
MLQDNKYTITNAKGEISYSADRLKEIVYKLANQSVKFEVSKIEINNIEEFKQICFSIFLKKAENFSLLTSTIDDFQERLELLIRSSLNLKNLMTILIFE